MTARPQLKKKEQITNLKRTAEHEPAATYPRLIFLVHIFLRNRKYIIIPKIG